MKPIGKKFVKLAEYFDYKTNIGLLLYDIAYKIGEYTENHPIISNKIAMADQFLQEKTHNKLDILSITAMIIAILLFAISIHYDPKNTMVFILIILATMLLYVTTIMIQKGSLKDNPKEVDIALMKSYYMVLPNNIEFAFIYDENMRIREYKFPEFIKQNIEAQVKDMYGYFIYHTGKENMPLMTLRKLTVLSSDSVKLHLGISSFFHIYYTHYFADSKLASVVSEEIYTGKVVTLRKMLAPYLQEFYVSQFEQTINLRQRESRGRGLTIDNIYKLCKLKGNNMDTAGELPNSIGMTGILILGDYYVIQVRERESMEGGSLTWSFSGLISPYSELVNDQEQINKQLSLYDFIRSEYNDEIANLILEEYPLSEAYYKVEPLAIVIDGQNLYQFELAVTVIVRSKLVPTMMQTLLHNSIVEIVNEPYSYLMSGKKFLLVHKHIIDDFIEKSSIKKSSLLEIIWKAYKDKYWDNGISRI